MSFKSLKKIFVLILISSVLLSSQFIQASAEDVSSFGNSKDKIVSGYFNYKTNINNIYEGSPIEFDSKDILVSDNKIEDNKVVINYGEVAKFNIDVPETAHYIMKLYYQIPDAHVLPTTLEVRINGDFPYDELRNVAFYNLWQRYKEPVLDRYNNEIVPDVMSVNIDQSGLIVDSSGRERNPLLIPLNEGTNELSLTSIEGNILIEKVEILALEKTKSYKNEKTGTVEGEHLIVIEGETPTLQNSPSTRPGSWFNKDLTPYDPKYKKLNYIDGLSFKEALQFVEYEFEVEESGEYHLGLRYLQDAKVDFSVFADIYLDGEIIYESLENYQFKYNTNFSDIVLHNDEGDLIFDLDKGKHVIRIELRIDPLQDILEEIEEIIYEVQQLSITIKNLVGNEVDKNRNFEILEYIPDVEDQLIGWADRLSVIYDTVQEIEGTEKNISAFASVQIAEKQLRSIASKRREIHIRVNELSTGTNSITSHLGSLLEGMNNNGISIDKLFFFQNKGNIPKTAGFFEKTIDSIQRFFISFGNQSYTVNQKNSDNLQVWVNRPRQYVEILQNMIDKDFTPKTGIKVDLSIMPDPNKLILANASGNAPDVALSLNYALPFDLAIRGAILDLTQFEGFEEVASQYSPNLHLPAMIGDSVYAMPETMNFYVMFYRTDILDNIGIEPFDTMEEVVLNLPILHQQGLNFFYPTAGMASMKIFAGTMPIIYQNNGRFYDETINRTLLNSKETIEGFKKLTDLFTIYNMPYDVPSFYQQFRDGSLPIGIADYGAYNLLTNAAPEIANLWDIALMPGYYNEDSKEVERWSSGGAESSIIFSDTERKDESWEFMKWWSSKDVQIQFGTTLQTSFGKEFMWNTANLEAFASLPWKSQHKEVVLEQAEWIHEVPRVLGTYMLERELSNAYNSVVLDGEDLRRAIDLATKRINRETNRKLEEFGYIKDGEIVEEYYTPYLEAWRNDDE